MGENLTRLLNHSGSLENLSDLVQFREDIQKFKINNCNIVEQFYDDKAKFKHKDGNGKILTKKYKRFLPKLIGSPDRRNVGIYSTAVCLDVITQYDKEIQASETIQNYSDPENAKQYFLFIIRGLSHRLHHNDDKNCEKESVSQPLLLSKINTLNRLSKYFNKHIKDRIEDNSELNQLKDIIIEIILEFNDKMLKNIETLHPYILYKFLIFLQYWDNLICKTIKELIKESPQSNKKLKTLNDKADKYYRGINDKKNKQKYKIYFFDKIYWHAKYELYRQMALKLSGDLVLYDVKRLIYSLLTVSIDNKFSNNLIRSEALRLIFEIQQENPNSLWPRGQLLNISKDSSESITTVECVYDLLEGEPTRDLIQSVAKFLPELNNIFHSVIRVVQLNINRRLKGWYSISQRDRTPSSWTTGIVMLFIKRFCQLISIEISNRAQQFFIPNYRTPSIAWGGLYDSTAVKSKLRLMFKKVPIGDDKFKISLNEKTAMFFGPPGTGKTTLARAIATELGWQYLELTPGDFYSGGVSKILPKINDIFSHLLHIKETVVFIDEIDDLVISREQKAYDPRTLYVNTLLPRFQDIHDHGNIILIASTNHIEKVDSAISRIGRFDLVIPVGPMSARGRIDYFFGKFTEKCKEKEKNEIDEITRESFNESVIDFVKLSNHYTFSQIKIFCKELFRAAEQENKILPDKIQINNIHKKLSIEKNEITLNENKFLNKIANKSYEKYKVSIRPFSMHDVDDIADFDNFVVSYEDIINLYRTLFILKNKICDFRNNIPFHDGISLFDIEENDLEKESSTAAEIIAKLCSEIDGKDDYYYCAATPYFDTLDYIINHNDVKYNYITNILREPYNKLKKLIYNRSII